MTYCSDLSTYNGVLENTIQKVKEGGDAGILLQNTPARVLPTCGTTRDSKLGIFGFHI